MQTRKNLNIWLPLLFALIMVAGMSIGFKLRENTTKQAGFFKVPSSSTLEEAVDIIERKYVDSLSADTLTQDAIKKTLELLDPHSAYIPAAILGEVNEDLQGNFKGIGVEFNIFSDTVHILNVNDKGPGDKAGLLTGDRFIKVGDSIVAGNGITSARIRKLLRGPEGTKVSVTIIRDTKPLSLVIERGMIPVPSVDASYMLETQTGYMHINKFSETTHREFAEQLEQLQKKGLQKLVVDLRDNGGGIMQEAVEIADEFLDGDKLIVYTQGNKQKRKDYRCKRKGLFESGKLVLLCNEGSASASEILLGALQDWDRATIIGRRSFGKGLVQEQYDLSDGSAMRLTVARYYTPSGRSIQKPYKRGGEGYYDEITNRFDHGEMTNADSNHIQKGAAFETSKGRKVYGGGGIMPDVFVAADTNNSNSLVLAKLFANNTLGNFAYRYYVKHKTQLKSFKSATDLYKQQQNDAALWSDFAGFAAKDSVDLKSLTPRDKVFTTRRLIALLARQQWRSNGFYEVLNANDEVVKTAIDVVGK
jgi:carboxyl-terminal processing protease